MEYKILAIIWLFLCSITSSIEAYVHWKFGKSTWDEYEPGKKVWTDSQFVTGILNIAFRMGIFFYLFFL